MLAPKDKLSEEEIETGLKRVIKDGLTSQMMVTLTGGIFLVAFALRLGASNTLIGLLVGIPSLMQLIQIPTIYLVEKFRRRKLITVFGSGISRIFWLLIATIPLVFSGQSRPIVFIIALIFISMFAAISNASWNSWIRDLIPTAIRIFLLEAYDAGDCSKYSNGFSSSLFSRLLEKTNA